MPGGRQLDEVTNLFVMLGDDPKGKLARPK
jgi:hypothetical protein